MKKLLRRLAVLLPTVLGVVTLIFFLIHFIPGDPVELMLGETASTADLERLEDAAWERVAVPSESGLVTLRQMLLHTIRHLEWHVGTIREKREAFGVE